MKFVKNQIGSTLVIELVLLALVAAAGGFTYYRVTQANKNAKVDVGTSVKHTVKPPPPADPTAAWTAYSNAVGKFSLRLKPGWQPVTCPSTPARVLVGGGCAATDAVPEIYVESSTDQTDYADLLNNTQKLSGFKSEAVTVSGVQGHRVSGLTTEGILSEGTVVVDYVFTYGGRVYLASYTKDPSSQPDWQADFDLMVKNTLKFSS